jgi:His-Xaa-Ser system radical SAM maturase HxsC
MLQLRGTATYVRGFQTSGSSEVLRISLPTNEPQHAADAALANNVEELIAAERLGFTRAVLLGDHPGADSSSFPNLLVAPEEFSYFADGDIIGFQPRSGKLRSLYRRGSAHNSFLVTERCNHNCLMCSQPPRNVDDRWVLDEISRALPLVDPETKSFAFTGGEPLLDWQEFTAVLAQCKAALPNTAVHVLTNGRAFARTEVVDAWYNVGHRRLTAGIPIYASVDHIHDYVVQAKGAFDETVLGILKLKDRKQRVEVRVVLHAITAPIVADTCRWLVRNLPFVDHVALMGLENTGFAIANDAILWIDPMDYRDVLAEGVRSLVAANMNVSVYNLPRCVVDRSIWRYAVRSISDWKNAYLDQCDGCSEKSNYSGFFNTGRPRYSRGVVAIP